MPQKHHGSIFITKAEVLKKWNLASWLKGPKLPYSFWVGILTGDILSIKIAKII